MGKITVAGLGPGGIEHLPVRTYDLLRSAPRIYLRTEKHPLVKELINQGICFESFDRLYEEKDSFQDVYESIVRILMEKGHKEHIVYAVPGHPMVAERSVELLLQSANGNLEVEILPAMSCLDALYVSLGIDPTRGLQIIDCLDLVDPGKASFNPLVPMLCTQLYDKRIASDVKLTLMESYPDDHSVVLVKGAGVTGEEKVKSLPLYELDRQDWIDYLTSLFVPALQDTPEANVYEDGFVLDEAPVTGKAPVSVESTAHETSLAGETPVSNEALKSGEDPVNGEAPFDTLVNIMDRLRRPDGCPWDAEQDFDTLKRYVIEETYEVVEAVEDHDMHKLQDELGDLLLQVVFYSQIAKEKGIFDVNGVIRGISQKLIRRHPHVFGEGVTVNCVEDVNVNWEKIKHNENKNRPRFDIPRELPALMRAEKVQKKAAEVGFDWPDIKGAWAKIHEELEELDVAARTDATHKVMDELGDVLFAVVNTARFLQVDPEEALTRTIDKFVKRFNYIESTAGQKGQVLEDMSLDEMDELWNQAKKVTK